MADRLLKYDVAMKSTKTVWQMETPRCYTGDENTVTFDFNITDLEAADLVGVIPNVYLYMRDGSFFQNGPADGVEITGTIVNYTMKGNEGKHSGIARAQLVLVWDDEINPPEKLTSQLYDFEVVSGLENKVAVEVMIQDWTTLTREARTFIDTSSDEVDALKGELQTAINTANASLGEFDVALETGIVAANLAEKLEDFEEINNSRLLSTERQLADIGYNFKREGGVVDSSDPILAALNTSLLRQLVYTCYQAGGGAVYIPDGTYYFAKFDEDEIIRAYSNVNIFGAGVDQTVLKCIGQSSTNAGFTFFRNPYGVDNVNYRDFTVDMYAQTMDVYVVAGKAFYISRVKNSTFKNLKIKGTPSTGMGIDHLSNVHIDNVHAYECGRLWGVIPSTSGPTLFDPNDPVTSNPYPGGAGIGIGTGDLTDEHFKITNCTAELCGHYGIFVEHQYIYRTTVLNESKDIVIANNIVRNNRFAGLGIRGGTRVMLVGNQSYGNGCFGLAVDSKGKINELLTLKDSIIASNSFNDNGLSGLHIDGYCGVSGLSIKGNDFLRNAEYGVSLGQYNASVLSDTLQENIIVKDNTFYGNGLGEVYQWDQRLVDYVNLVIDNNNYLATIAPNVINLVDDTDTDILYSGTGWRSVYTPTCHGGSAHQANKGLGSTYAKFVFDGTGFKWFTPTGANKGKALVTVDYSTPIVVDLYTPTTEADHVVYAVSGLESGVHTVSIDYLASKNVDSSAYGVTIDALIIDDGVLLNHTADNKIRIEDGDSKIAHAGIWDYSVNDMFSNGRCKFTKTTGEYAEFSFTGTAIDMHVATGSNKGKARLFLNGVETVVDMYSATTVYNNKVFSATGLDPVTPHTLRIEYTGFKNDLSTDTTILIDSFVITGGDIVAP